MDNSPEKIGNRRFNRQRASTRLWGYKCHFNRLFKIILCFSVSVSLNSFTTVARTFVGNVKHHYVCTSLWFYMSRWHCWSPSPPLSLVWDRSGHVFRCKNDNKIIKKNRKNTLQFLWQIVTNWRSARRKSIHF